MQMTKWRHIICSLCCFDAILAHRSLPAGVTCGNQFNNSADALTIPESTISWASNRISTCDAPIFWLTTSAAAKQNLSFTALVPLLQRFDPVRLSVLVIGPGLPSLNDSVSVPVEARNAIGSGEGGVLFESPTDQSTCDHLEEVMTANTVVSDGRCVFHEPYSDTYSWVLLDRMLETIESGEHRFAVFVAGSTTTKLTFACCDWPEDFTTAYDIPTAKCPYCGTSASFTRYNSLFFETHTMVNYSGFPALQDCTVDSGPPAPPTNAQCPNVTSDDDSSVQPESCTLGCSGEDCHSHNALGECTYFMYWITPKPQMGAANVTKLSLFKGDKVTFSSVGHSLPHNLVKMASATSLDSCDFTDSEEVLSIEAVRDGTAHSFSETGTFYYSCGMSGHCELGQILTVEVEETGTGITCHNHALNNSMVCSDGTVNAYIMGSADYGAEADQCAEICTSEAGIAWITGAAVGSCSDQGFEEIVIDKTVQPAGSPMAVQVRIMSNESESCHCHMSEDIACGDTGDSLYDEHVTEIEQYCMGIVNGTEDVCPYLCYQPFVVMHMHYIECPDRSKDSTYLSVEATKKCHTISGVPSGTNCGTDADVESDRASQVIGLVCFFSAMLALM